MCHQTRHIIKPPCAPSVTVRALLALFQSIGKQHFRSLFSFFHQLTKIPYAVSLWTPLCLGTGVDRPWRRSDVIYCQKCLATQQSAGWPLKAVTCWLIFMGTTEHTGNKHSREAHWHISVWLLTFPGSRGRFTTSRMFPWVWTVHQLLMSVCSIIAISCPRCYFYECF